MNGTVMSVGTIARFLIGDRESILAIARTRGALAIGALLVLSAALAREYDGEYLIAEPWHLLLPFGASLTTSLVLYGLIRCVAWCRGVRELPFWPAYTVFLTVYWMTAPLAWLYAIPYDRFLSAGDATALNLWTLGIVSLWRVALITRVIAILFGTTAIKACLPVMLFASAVALGLLRFSSIPVVSRMGGIHLDDAEQLIRTTSILLIVLSVLTLPIWLVGTLCVCFSSGNWQWSVAGTGDRPSRSLLAMAMAAVAVGVAVLPWTQPPQAHRYRAETLLRQGQVAEGLAEMSRNTRDDYPPHWVPPPRVAYGETQPPLLDVFEQLVEQRPASWVVENYLAAARYRWQNAFAVLDWHRDTNEEEFQRWLKALRKLPEGPELARDIIVAANSRHWSQRDSPPTDHQLRLAPQLLGEDERSRARALMEVAGIEVDEVTPQ